MLGSYGILYKFQYVQTCFDNYGSKTKIWHQSFFHKNVFSAVQFCLLESWYFGSESWNLGIDGSFNYFRNSNLLPKNRVWNFENAKKVNSRFKNNWSLL